MRWLIVFMLAAAVAMASSCPAQSDPPGLPSGLKDAPLALPNGAGRDNKGGAVQFVSPVQAMVTANRPGELDLHFLVRNGLHINSHRPTDKNLIPTRLAIIEGAGINVSGASFPPGAAFTPQFDPKERLSVYSGEFIVQARLKAAPGQHLLRGALRYQACDITSCMPPKTLSFELGVMAK